MLVFDRENWPYHRSWCMGTVAATAVAAGWYIVHGFGSGSWNWPGGGSPPAFAFGAVGGLIILFEMLLWPRKSLWRAWRIGRTKWWMTAHLWLGLLAFPLLLLHGAFHFSLTTSTLAAVLMWLLVIVVGSGIFGLVVQHILPRLMLENVPAETIHSQIGHILDQYRAEAGRLVGLTCGLSGAAGRGAGGLTGRIDGDAPSFVSVGTVRQVGRVQGKVVQVGIEAGYVPESEALLAFFQEHVEPYLQFPLRARLALVSPKRAASMFQSLKACLRPDAHHVVDCLADLCDQRRQFELQARLHRWLHSWLGVHVALSVALLGLMLVHVFLALKYV
jgi:hypothetical protein